MIEYSRDPRTKKEMTIVSGIVKAVYFNPLKQVKTYDSGKGKSWTPTHSVAILVDNEKVSLGLTDKEVIRAKDPDDEYQDVLAGAEVSIEINEVGEYNGKPTYSAFISGIIVINPAPAKAEAPAKSEGKAEGKKEYFKKDLTGMLTGHCQLGAANFIASANTSMDDLIAAAKQVHDITSRVKVYYTELRADLNENDIGNASGNAVNTAIALVKARGGDFAQVEKFAKMLLKNSVPALYDYIKNGEGKEPEGDPFAESVDAAPEPVKETPAPVEDKKPRGRPAKAKEEPKPVVEDLSDDPFGDDDGAPF